MLTEKRTCAWMEVAKDSYLLLVCKADGGGIDTAAPWWATYCVVA